MLLEQIENLADCQQGDGSHLFPAAVVQSRR